MADCEDLRNSIREAKRRRNDAMVANAVAKNNGLHPTYSDADMAALRLAVDLAALEARNAGCKVDDLVGPNVGNLDWPD